MLVSNAATGVIRPALELEERHWDWTMNANARALLTLARSAAPRMQPGSSIVAISSLGSRACSRTTCWSESQALDARPVPRGGALAAGIHVNAVSAGLVETGASRILPNREEMLEWYRRAPGRPARRAARRRRGRLLPRRPAAGMIRGQTVVVDSGYPSSRSGAPRASRSGTRRSLSAGRRRTATRAAPPRSRASRRAQERPILGAK